MTKNLGRCLLNQCNYFNLVSKRWFNVHSVKGPVPGEIPKLQEELYGHFVRENQSPQFIPIPLINNRDEQSKRTLLFNKEKAKQFRSIGRIEKIEIEYEGQPENQNLLMNKNISTPYDCARHMAEYLTDRSIIAEINGQLWDMHRPLEENGKLRLLHMKLKDEDLQEVNNIFWRSCSFMLGCVLERAFKDHIYIELHSFPQTDVQSGSFAYDADLKLKDWKPKPDEMRIFSAEMMKLSRERLHFERLEIDIELALKMFENNKYKIEQIPHIAENSSNKNSVCVYKIGNFVDIAQGPLMSHTGQIGKCTISSLHNLNEYTNCSDSLYRIQGMALPAGFLLNHFAYGLIEERSKKLNLASLPSADKSDHHNIMGNESHYSLRSGGEQQATV